MPLEPLGAAEGATLTPVSPAGAPVFTGLGERHTGGDHLTWTGAFRTGAREVSLAVGEPGQDPPEVGYQATLATELGGDYAGELDLSGLDPGTYSLYARACFAPGSCGYATAPLTV